MEKEIDLVNLIQYFWKRKKIILYIVLGFVLLKNITFFLFDGFMYSNVGKIRISNEASTNKVISYNDLLTSDSVLDAAISNSGVDTNKANIKNNLSIRANDGSMIYTITLNYKNKQDGKKLCASIINEFVSNIESYDGNYAELFDEVVTNDNPVNFNIIKNEFVYITIGAVLGISYLFAAFFFDNRIKGQTELEEYNLLGKIDNLQNNLSLIKTKIKLNNFGKIIFINTPRVIDCKNIIFKLVDEFAKDSKVLFIDTNFRNNKSKRMGYSDLLRNYKEDISKYVENKKYKFDMMDCGTISSDSEILLSSKNNEKLINYLGKKYDYIILFNSNIVDYSDSLILSKLCDCNYMLVGINQTDRRDFEKSIEAYSQVNSKFDGIIVIDNEKM